MAAEPIPPGKRRRLQQMFEHASKAADADYAIKLFTECVVGDPANRIYVQQLLSTLARKYNNNPKNVGRMAGISSMGAKTSLKKASMQKDWPAVIAAGIEALKSNPWDITTLCAMANACDQLELAESQLQYLNFALNINSKDPDVNRLCGRALSRLGRFDEAIACFHRVQQAKPADEEAQRAIADLAVERTISHGKYEEAASSTDVRVPNKHDEDDQKQLTPEQQLEKKISKQPADLSLYVELADMHLRHERLPEAETVMGKALEVSGGDVSVRERLEDIQLRRHRADVTAAERRSETEKTEEAGELAKKMREELNLVELDIYRARCDRNPTNYSLKFEYGLRLKRAGKYRDAIQLLQQARADSKRKALVHYELGECFQKLKQYPLALKDYEASIEATSERDVEGKKVALYAAGRLALAMAINDANNSDKWLDAAEKHLNELAGLDFGYKDVHKLLDKLAEMRNKA